MRLWRRLCGWVELSILEGRLQRGGYRRLHEAQVEESQARSKRVLYDLADAVLALEAVADEVEAALEDMDGADD
jgi:hypothetical protein